MEVEIAKPRDGLKSELSVVGPQVDNEQDPHPTAGAFYRDGTRLSFSMMAPRLVELRRLPKLSA